MFPLFFRPSCLAIAVLCGENENSTNEWRACQTQAIRVGLQFVQLAWDQGGERIGRVQKMVLLSAAMPLLECHDLTVGFTRPPNAEMHGA